MSSTYLDVLPGDLLVALRPMRAWENDRAKGTSGCPIGAGEQALVLETWTEGHQRRVRVIRDQRLLLFSCPDHVACRNWRLARRG
jgi:hypothetical protein